MNAQSQPYPLALGIDGGASTLKWSLATPQGDVHHGRSEGANAQVLGLDLFVAKLLDIVRTVLNDHEFAMDLPLTLGLGLSGVDRPAEKERLSRAFAQACPAMRGFWVGNDALAALRQGAGALQGIVLIAGSGSICVGVSPEGETLRTGGWGLAMGDEGSGAWIGLRGLNAATRMADGRLATTPLMKALLDDLNLDEAKALIPWATALDPSEFKRRTAALAPTVIKLARSGEAQAQHIMSAALEHLAALVTATQTRLNANRPEPEPVAPMTLVCAGGLLEHEEGLFEDLKALLEQRRGGNLAIVRLDAPASMGALNLGREHPRASA